MIYLKTKSNKAYALFSDNTEDKSFTVIPFSNLDSNGNYDSESCTFETISDAYVNLNDKNRNAIIKDGNDFIISTDMLFEDVVFDSSLSKHKVLVFEDNKYKLDKTVKAINEIYESPTIYAATKAIFGYRYIKKDEISFDMISIDMMMPEGHMGGIQTDCGLRILTKLDYYSNIVNLDEVIIFMNTSDRDNTIEVLKDTSYSDIPIINNDGRTNIVNQIQDIIKGKIKC